MQDALRCKIHVVHFPSELAGTPVDVTTSAADPDAASYTKYQVSLGSTQDKIYAPFAHKTEWDLIRWAKTRGPGSNTFDELLKIDGVSIVHYSTW